MIDKEVFLKGGLPEGDVQLGAVTVRVRGLSRQEVIDVQRYAEDLAELERHIIAAGFLDPPLSYDDACQWYQTAPSGDIDKVTEAIQRLSGMDKEHPKSGLPGVRGEPGP